ncbi:MAG TPA: ABC transporter permease [Vicinamibacterales bacterium]
MVDSLGRDLRFALRLIRKAPVLSIATIVTLALGIGLNAGVFTVLSGLLLRPRVTVNPDTFVHLQPAYTGASAPRPESPQFSTRDYFALRDRATTLGPLVAWTVRNTRIGENTPFQELTLLVSCGFFDVYGLDRFERGRPFRPEECSERPVPVAIVSDEFWQRHLDADPDVLDRPLVINGRPFTVVGVTPAAFPGRVRGEGVWIPYAWEPAITLGPAAFNNPATAWLWVDGRLRPGATSAVAVSELNVLMRQQDTLVPGRVSAVTVNNGALIHEPHVRPVAMFIMPLVLGSVGLVLLIACGNVTLLLLSRAVARRREIGIRLAIGCSRGRLAQMLLTESVLLAALGMPLSIWLASQAPAVMRRSFPMMPTFPMSPDATVFSYLVAASLVAGLTAGLAPAIESLRQRLTPMLAGQDVVTMGGRRGIRDVLIAAQLGMSLVLLAGTVIFLRAEHAIALRDPSVDAAHVMTATYEPPRGTSAAMMPAMSARLQQLPGVRSIAYVVGSGEGFDSPRLSVRGRSLETRRSVPITLVSASYFDVMRQPLLQGRGFAGIAAEESGVTVRPLVISDVLARVWWTNETAVGAELESSDGRRFQVVGVVHSDVAFSAGTADSIMAFALAPQAPASGSFFVRFDGDAPTLQSAMHGVLREMTPNAAAMPMTLAAADAVIASRFMPFVEMVGSLGVTAILLALVGVYGVVSFAVGRRTREIGIRMALGATRFDIARMIVSSSAPPIAAGIVGGLVLLVPAAIALTRLFQNAPVPFHPLDPVPNAVVAAALALIAFATMLVPAKRATGVSPSVALRTD